MMVSYMWRLTGHPVFDQIVLVQSCNLLMEK